MTVGPPGRHRCKGLRVNVPADCAVKIHVARKIGGGPALMQNQCEGRPANYGCDTG